MSHRDAATQGEVRILVEAAQLDADDRAIGAVGTVDDTSERGAAWHGKRVLAGALDACGECDVCRRGGAPVCPRGRARDVRQRELRASARWLVALGDGLELPGPTAAAVPGDVALAYTLYARTNLAPREPVVVVGGDAVARFLVQILRAKGIEPVVAADVIAHGATLDEARAAVGAALTASGQDPAAAKLGGRPWRVIATEGGLRAAQHAGPRATLTLAARATIDAGPALAAALAREVSVLGVAGPHPDLVLDAAALAAKGEADLAAGTIVRRADDTWPRPPTRSLVVTLA